MWSSIVSRVGGFLGPYLWYIVAIAIGAFGIVLYLYADEVDDHRETAGELAVLMKDHQLLQDEYKKLGKLKDEEARQRQLLQDELAKTKDAFEDMRSKNEQSYEELRRRQEELAALKEQQARLGERLKTAQEELLAVERWEPVTEARVASESLIELRPTQEVDPGPQPTDEEIQDAVCNTTPFSEPVTDYINNRLSTIYENGVSLSDGGD